MWQVKSISEYLQRAINIFRQRENPDLRGCGLDDPFLRYVKGYKERDRAVNDAMMLHNEVDGIKHALFPPRSKPSPKPGYVTYEWQNFTIEYEKQEVREDLERYFLDRHGGLRRGFGDEFKTPKLPDLSELLGLFLGEQLLVDGKAFYAIDWGKVDIDDRSYILPRDLSYICTSTMKVRRRFGRVVGFKQRYSLLTRLKEKHLALRNRDFSEDEVFFVMYPFDRKSPVQRSLKYLSRIIGFSDFGLAQSKAGAQPEDFSLELERARYKTYKQEKKKHDLARAKVRREFNYLAQVDVKITSYYDIYSVVRYKKFLNNLRSFLVEEFNKQIFRRMAQKNGWQDSPRLSMIEGYFMSNREIDEYFRQYCSREIDLDTFIKEVIKSD